MMKRPFGQRLGSGRAESSGRDAADCRTAVLVLRNTYNVDITPWMLDNVGRGIEKGWQPTLVLAAVVLCLSYGEIEPDWSYFEGILRQQTRRSHGFWTHKIKAGELR